MSTARSGNSPRPSKLSTRRLSRYPPITVMDKSAWLVSMITSFLDAPMPARDPK